MAKKRKKKTTRNQNPTKRLFEDLPSSKKLDLAQMLAGESKGSTKTPKPERSGAAKTAQPRDSGFRRNGGRGRRGWGGRLKPHELAEVL